MDWVEKELSTPNNSSQAPSGSSQRGSQVWSSIVSSHISTADGSSQRAQSSSQGMQSSSLKHEQGRETEERGPKDFTSGSRKRGNRFSDEAPTKTYMKNRSKHRRGVSTTDEDESSASGIVDPSQG